jgi:predicted MFS family arabinose efflux permease
MILPLIPLFAQSLGAAESLVGIVVACFHLLAMFLAIPLGGLIERFGLRCMLICGAGCNVLYSLLILVAHSLWILIVAQVIGGLGFLLLVVATQTHVGSMQENNAREKGFGLVTLSAAVGQTLGPALGGVLLAYAGYGCVFAVALGLSLLGALTAAGSGPKMPPAKDKDIPHVARREQIKSLLSSTRLVCTLAFTFSVVVVVSLRGSFLPLLLQEKGISESHIGILLSCFALSMTLVRVVVGRILGRTSRLNLLLFTLVCLITGSGLVPLLGSPILLGMSLALFGLGFGFSQPLSMVMISDVSGSGLAMGIRFFSITTANFLSSLTMGWVAEYFSLGLTFYLGAAFLTLMGIWIAWTLASEGNNFETDNGR